MILEGWSDQALMLAQLQRALPVSWDEQGAPLQWLSPCRTSAVIPVL
jgi:hypothetical protein